VIFFVISRAEIGGERGGGGESGEGKVFDRSFAEGNEKSLKRRLLHALSCGLAATFPAILFPVCLHTVEVTDRCDRSAAINRNRIRGRLRGEADGEPKAKRPRRATSENQEAFFVKTLQLATNAQASERRRWREAHAFFPPLPSSSFILSFSPRSPLPSLFLPPPPPQLLRFFETFSYLPPLSDADIAKQVDYITRNGWVPALEFADPGQAYVADTNTVRIRNSVGYQDNRYWSMYKLPMFGCTDSSQVLKEIQSATKSFPKAYIRLVAFDPNRQVQVAGMLVHRPKSDDIQAPESRSI